MRKSRKGDDDERSIPKIVLLVAALVLVFMSTSVILAAYPQHLFIDNKTVINSAVGFKDNHTVNIRGSMVQYGQNDIIPIDGQDFIRVTANQVQLGNSTFVSGVRQLSARIYQNVLFEQQIGEFDISRAAQVGVDGDVIALIPISVNVLNVRTSDSYYNIELVQGISFLKTKNNIMLKLQKENNKIKVSIVGLKNYDNVWMRTV